MGGIVDDIDRIVGLVAKALDKKPPYCETLVISLKNLEAIICKYKEDHVLVSIYDRSIVVRRTSSIDDIEQAIVELIIRVLVSMGIKKALEAA